MRGILVYEGLNKLIKSRDKYNPKIKTSFTFHLKNKKSGKKYFLQIWIRIQNMSAIYDTNKLLLREILLEPLKDTCEEEVQM